MKRILIALALVSFQTACRRYVDANYPERVVYQYLLENLVYNNGKPRLQSDVPIYISHGNVSEGRDVDSETLQNLRRVWPVRTISEARPIDVLKPQVVDRKTGQQGWMIWIRKISKVQSDTLSVQCGTYHDGMASESYEILINHTEKGWKIEKVIFLGGS